MIKKRKIESVQEFSFTLTRFDTGAVQVVLTTRGVEFDDLVMATKYMMWIVSNATALPFDETMELLAEGAATFDGVGLKVLPGKKGKES